MISLALFPIFAIGLATAQFPTANRDGSRIESDPNEPSRAQYRQFPPNLLQDILYRQPPPQPEKIKIEVYYETLCPFCKEFFIYNLEPTFADLSDYIDLDLIPFGNAQFNKTGGKLEIVCLHGPEECLLNRITACAFDMLTDMHAKVGIATCLLENNKKPLKDLSKCSREVGLSAKKVLECVRGPRGFQLDLANGKKTISERQQVPDDLFGTPWVTINKNWKTWVFGHRTLREIICDMLQGRGELPEGCPQPPFEWQWSEE